MEEQTFEKDLGKVVGTDGITPHIGENGNWFFGEKDSGVPATGPQGEKGEPGTAPPLYRHRVRASGAVTSGSITHYAAAYIDVYTRSDTAILSARNLAEALSISYGGTKTSPRRVTAKTEQRIRCFVRKRQLPPIRPLMCPTRRSLCTECISVAIIITTVILNA